MFYAGGLTGRRYYGAYTAPGYRPEPETEKQALQRQAEELQSQLDLINKRLAEFETNKGTE
jgi:hypothetical protein